MRLVIDQDDTLVQLNEGLVREWNDWGRKHEAENVDLFLTLEDVISFDFWFELDRWWIEQMLANHRFMHGLLPVPGAAEGMAELQARGHDLVVATALSIYAPEGYLAKEMSMRERFPFISPKSFMMCRRKDLIEADVLFDDGVHNVVAWDRKERASFLRDRPWNRDFETEGTLVTRVGGWPEFVQHIKERE